ncbi:MAG: HPr family phosphocarrier protein [Hungatella sp.]
MKQVFIKFSTAQQVVDFVNIMSQCEYDVDLKAGSITVDAKSIVGVFSMAKANQLEVVLHMDDTY